MKKCITSEVGLQGGNGGSEHLGMSPRMLHLEFGQLGEGLLKCGHTPRSKRLELFLGLGGDVLEAATRLTLLRLGHDHLTILSAGCIQFLVGVLIIGKAP